MPPMTRLRRTKRTVGVNQPHIEANIDGTDSSIVEFSAASLGVEWGDGESERSGEIYTGALGSHMSEACESVGGKR